MTVTHGGIYYGNASNVWEFTKGRLSATLNETREIIQCNPFAYARRDSDGFSSFWTIGDLDAAYKAAFNSMRDWGAGLNDDADITVVFWKLISKPDFSHVLNCGFIWQYTNGTSVDGLMIFSPEGNKDFEPEDELKDRMDNSGDLDAQ